jgi:signal transduction histidine kinase
MSDDVVLVDGDDDDRATIRFARGTREQVKLELDDVQPVLCGRCDAHVESIVHDLKNPIATLGLELDVLGHLASTHDARSVMARMRQTLGYMERLVHQMLDRAAPLQVKETELGELVRVVVARVVASRDVQRIVVHAPECVIALVDPAAIERVIANLIDNAIAYSHSTITIEIERCERGARIAVIDCGRGIAAHEVWRIFEKRVRGEAGAVRDGHGLGLHICRAIVEAHGGFIGVTSAPGSGSRFCVELPLSGAP